MTSYGRITVNLTVFLAMGLSVLAGFGNPGTAAEASTSAHGRLAALPAVDGCGKTVRKATGKAWTCTFADDFSGTHLDPAKWNVLTSAYTSTILSECRVDNARNISVADGQLKLSARRLDREINCHTGAGDYRTRYTGGAVTTSRKFATRYGRVEIRAAMPRYRGRGFHSALWMFPQDPAYGAWPRSGEIDINEYRTGLFGRAVPTLHRLRNGVHRMITKWTCAVRRPQDFHSYVLEWSRSRISFIYDGKVCLTRRFDPDRPNSAQPFDQEFYLILNQSNGAGLNAPTSWRPRRGSMRIDYVRAWR